MFRKLALPLAAIAAVAAAALASPTPAAAGWGHHHRHVHFGHRHFGGPVVVVGDYGCWRKRFISTPYGVIVKRVNVCY